MRRPRAAKRARIGITMVFDAYPIAGWDGRAFNRNRNFRLRADALDIWPECSRGAVSQSRMHQETPTPPSQQPDGVSAGDLQESKRTVACYFRRRQAAYPSGSTARPRSASIEGSGTTWKWRVPVSLIISPPSPSGAETMNSRK